MAMRGHISNYNFYFHNFFSTSAILFYISIFFFHFQLFLSHFFGVFLLPIFYITSNFYLLFLFFKLQTVLMQTQTRLVLSTYLKVEKLQLFGCFSSQAKLVEIRNSFQIEIHFKTMTCMRLSRGCAFLFHGVGTKRIRGICFGVKCI